MNCWLVSFRYLWAESNRVANLLWVEVVIHNLVDDPRKLCLHESIALCLKACSQKATKGVTDLFCECNNLVLGGVAGDDVHTDRTGQLIPALGDKGKGGGKKSRGAEE